MFPKSRPDRGRRGLGLLKHSTRRLGPALLQLFPSKFVAAFPGRNDRDSLSDAEMFPPLLSFGSADRWLDIPITLGRPAASDNKPVKEPFFERVACVRHHFPSPSEAARPRLMMTRTSESQSWSTAAETGTWLQSSGISELRTGRLLSGESRDALRICTGVYQRGIAAVQMFVGINQDTVVRGDCEGDALATNTGSRRSDHQEPLPARVDFSCLDRVIQTFAMP